MIKMKQVINYSCGVTLVLLCYVGESRAKEGHTSRIQHFIMILVKRTTKLLANMLENIQSLYIINYMSCLLYVN